MERITELLWQRSENAITELARSFGATLHRLARNIIGDHNDAEEAVNDTYMALWNAIPPQKPEPLAPFVYRVGKNIALNRARHNAAQKRAAYEISLEELSGCIAGPDLWETLDARALGRAIDAFLGTLDEENRILFLRRYWFGDSVQELARQFSITENALSVRLSRIRDKLKAYLIKEGFYE